jgi:hypothetical protein
MIDALLKKDHLTTFLTLGDEKFYNLLLFISVSKLVYLQKNSLKDKSPEIEFLDYYEENLTLYRRNGEQIYLDLAKIFRRAANKVYRSLLKKKLIKRSDKFLNVIEAN